MSFMNGYKSHRNYKDYIELYINLQQYLISNTDLATATKLCVITTDGVVSYNQINRFFSEENLN